MLAEITPSRLSGTVSAIASKSDVHRLLICAALSESPTEIELLGSMTSDKLSKDIKATIHTLAALGAHFEYSLHSIFVTPISDIPKSPVLDCKESGSTLRFMLPVAAALLQRANAENPDTEILFTGSGRLPSRPIGELVSALNSGGVTFSSDTLPFKISGALAHGTYTLTGDVSSQYITGLLLGLAALPPCGDVSVSRVRLSSALQSSAYVDITLSAMRKFGVEIKEIKDPFSTFTLPCGRFVSPSHISADGDWSNAAFFSALSALGHDVTVSGLDYKSPQGDKAITELLSRLFASGTQGSTQSDAQSDTQLDSSKMTVIDLKDIPDLLPVLAVCAAFSEHGAEFVGGERLRIKESDRLHSVCSLICSLGGMAEELSNGLRVLPQRLLGGTVDSFNDHRIVMAAAIAASNCKTPVIIQGADAVEKSYPTFFEDYARLGGKVNVI